jgi:hypothetical protein
MPKGFASIDINPVLRITAAAAPVVRLARRDVPL